MTTRARCFPVIAGAAALMAASGLRADPPRQLLSLPWGAGAGEVGQRGGDESAFEGPSSLAPAPDGTLLLLDQVNRRLLQLSAKGEPIGEIDIGHDTFEDVAVLDGGEIALLDRLYARTVRLLAADGTPLLDVPVEGPGIPEAGLVTALLAADDGIWLEVEHSYSVRLLDQRLAVDPERPRIPGRPLVGCDLALRARLTGTRALSFTLAGRGGAPRREGLVWLSGDVEHVSLVERSRAGELVVAAVIATQQRAHAPGCSELALEVVVLGHDLKPLRRAQAPLAASPWAPLRELALTPDGTLYHLVTGPAGAEVRTWQP